MAVYAKVDEQGNVLEFPYHFRDLRKVPDDAVKCDTVSQRLPTKWYEGLWYDRVEKEDDNYVVYYKIGPKKYSSDFEKKQTLTILIAQAKIDSERNLSLVKITQEQHEENIQILNSIDVNDETTYDSFDTIKLQ